MVIAVSRSFLYPTRKLVLATVASIALAACQTTPDAEIAAIARYPDQIAELTDAGVDFARNLYEEAGQGLADDAIAVLWGSGESSERDS